MRYPAIFPRPTAQFGEKNTAFALRTPMESGRSRERKRWSQPYTTYELNFELSTSMFYQWSSWVQANAYSSNFEMELDIVSGARMKRFIRFITPYRFKYTNWDTVVIDVVAEELNILANPEAIPPLPQGVSYPECQPYDCAAYENWLSTLSAEVFTSFSKTAAKAYREAGSGLTAPPWPFSTNTGVDGSHIMYTNYVASPNAQTTWGGSSPNTNQVSLDYFNADSLDITDATLCTGRINCMGALNPNTQSLGSTCIVPSGAANFSQAQTGEAWGDHYIEALICGHDIERAGDVISGTMIRGSGSLWKWTRNGVQVFEDDPATCGVSASTANGSDVTMTLYINQPSANPGPNLSTSFTVPNASLKLQLFGAGVSSGTPFETQGADGKWYMARQVTVSCAYAGGSKTLSGLQFYSTSFATQKPPTNVLPWYQTTWPARLYAYAQYFYGVQLNFATFAGGKTSAEGIVRALDVSKIYWDRNASNYQVPGWCGPQ